MSGTVFSCIFNDGEYVYSSYDDTVFIYNLSTQLELFSVTYDWYITSIFSNDLNIFFGTSYSGVYVLDKEALSVSHSDEDVYNSTLLYKQYPNITGNEINFIHGNNSCVSFCTESGVDFFKLEPNGYRSYTNVVGADRCFMYSERELFYTVCSGTNWFVCKTDPISNWETRQNFIPIGSSLINLVEDIKDFKVAKNSAHEEIAFINTNIGVGIINQTKNESIYLTEL